MNRPHLTGDALRQWRELQRLSQEELGRLLGTSREWVGKLERGEREISAEIFLRFERIRQEPRFSSRLPGETYVVAKEQTPYGTPEMIEREIRALMDGILANAVGDTGRLGWIREQLRMHLRMPEHWVQASVGRASTPLSPMHEKAMSEAIAQERRANRSPTTKSSESRRAGNDG